MRNGLILTATIAVAATMAGRIMPVIGAAVFSILFGILIRQFFPIPASFEQGIKFSSKKMLQWGIIVMGFTLNFKTAVGLGWSSLPITLTTIIAALIISFVVGRLMNIPERIRTLIGIGTAICGGSAIAAASPIVEADDEEIAFSISTIFLFNIIAVFIFPVLGHLLNMSSTGFGYFAGTAINDTSSVVAAGYTFSKEAGDTATVVKLVRALMIVPVCLLLALLQLRKHSRNKVVIHSIFPWFILYFFIATLITSFVPLPTAALKWLSSLMIAMALAGIGLSVNLRTFRTIGYRPVVLGAVTWFVVAAVSLIMQQLLHIW